MKLVEYFRSFLTNTVNLNDSRLEMLDLRVQSIVACLGLDDTIGPLLEEHIPQGSWAHRTIIKPVNGREFDADVLVHLTEVDDWTADPKRYLQEVRAAFRRSSTYRDLVQKKNRCVRIDYANDCHVDVVPYIVLADPVLEDGRQVIVNYAENDFEDTNPQGFTSWIKEKDDLANGNLRRVVRLLKYLRDFKTTFSVPSVILTNLLGERVQGWDADERYKDVPTTLLNVLADLDAWLQLYPTMPVLEDPSCPGTTFNHRWDQARYENFRTQIGRNAGWVKEAYDEPDRNKSVAAWQRIFGPDFKAPVTTMVEAAAPGSRLPMVRAPREEFIEERGLTLVGGYRARIDATVIPVAGFRGGPLRSIKVLRKNRELRFKVTTDVPEPFDVFWKVRNTGDEAARVGQLRGEIVSGYRTHKESTLYSGRHYVEVYIVKNRRVLASDRHRVDIA